MQTMLLSVPDWDITLDAAGNLALAKTEPYAMAQDAASEIKLFRGELYYDTSQGVPYYQNILGKIPNLAFCKAQWEAAARKVPGVVQAIVIIASFIDRQITGQVQITDRFGRTATARFTRTL